MAAAARFRPVGAAQSHHLTIPVIATYLGVAPASLHGWIAPEGAGGAESRSLRSRVPSASPGRNCTCDAGYDFDAQNLTKFPPRFQAESYGGQDGGEHYACMLPAPAFRVTRLHRRNVARYRDSN